MLSSLRLYVMASLTDRHRHAVSRVNPSSPLSPLNRFNSRKEKGKFVTDDPAFSNDSGTGSSFGKIIDNFRDPNVFHVVVVGRPMNSARVFDLSRIHARVRVRVYVIYVGAVEVEIEAKYENPGSAGTPVAGRFRVLSTSRLTSRTRQKNIHNEREYGEFSFGGARAGPEPFTKIAPRPPSARGKTWKNGAEAASFPPFQCYPDQKFPLAYIFLIKVILAGLHEYVEFINEHSARMLIRLHRIGSSNFPYSRFIHPCARFFHNFPAFQNSTEHRIQAKYRGRVFRPAVINPRSDDRLRRVFLPPPPFLHSSKPQRRSVRKREGERNEKREQVDRLSLSLVARIVIIIIRTVIPTVIEKEIDIARWIGDKISEAGRECNQLAGPPCPTLGPRGWQRDYYVHRPRVQRGDPFPEWQFARYIIQRARLSATTISVAVSFQWPAQ